MAYQSRYCQLALKYGLLGFDMAEVAEVLGETPGTVDEWIDTVPEFRDVVERSRSADSQIEQAFYRACEGYEEVVERLEMRDGEPTLVKRHPPRRPSVVCF